MTSRGVLGSALAWHLVVLVALCVPAAVVVADTIFLESGGRVVGKIIDETEDVLVLQTRTGVMRIRKSEIRSIQRDEDVQAVYHDRCEELAVLEKHRDWQGAAQGWYELGVWCQEKGLKIQAVDCFQKAVANDSDHAAARARLGYLRYHDEWLTEDEWKRRQGLVEWDGAWVTPEERENYKQGLVKREDGTWGLPDAPFGTSEEPAPQEPVAQQPEPQVAAGPQTAEPEGARPKQPKPPRKTPSAEPKPGVTPAGPQGGVAGPAFDEESRKARIEERCNAESWKAAFATRYYDFYTNGPEADARSLGLVMDRMFEEYRGIFDYQDPLTEPFVVTLFADQREFMGRTGQGQGVGGYYDGEKIVAFHGGFAGLSTQEVLFHEGTHQFQGLILPDGLFFRRAKTWLVEGLAVYFESSKFESGHLRTGVIPVDRLVQLKQAVRQNAHVPLEQLIRMSQAQFGSAEYGEAWSLIYFFVHAYDGRNRKYFIDYFHRVKQGGSDPVEAFEEVFNKPMAEIEGYWKEYVLGMETR